MNKKRSLLILLAAVLVIVGVVIIVNNKKENSMHYEYETSLKDFDPTYVIEDINGHQPHARFQDPWLYANFGFHVMGDYDKHYPTEYSFTMSNNDVCKAYLCDEQGKRTVYFKIFTYKGDDVWWNCEKDYYMCTYPTEEQVNTIEKGTTLSQVRKVFPNVEYELKYYQVPEQPNKAYALYEGGICIITVEQSADHMISDNLKVLDVEKIKYGEKYDGEYNNAIEILQYKEFIESFVKES